MTQKKAIHPRRNWALLAVIAVALSACGFVTAPAKHAVARTAQVGVKTYDKGVEKSEEAAIMVRDTTVVAAHVVADASVKAAEVASETSEKVFIAAKNTSISALEKAQELPGTVKSAVAGIRDDNTTATTAESTD